MNIDGETLLYDAGTTINDALDDRGISVDTIDNIFISHLHADHAGGIEYLAFKRYFSQFPFGESKANLIGSEEILIRGWDHVWSGGLEHMRGKDNLLSDYFNIKSLTPHESFQIKDFIFVPVFQCHVDGDASYGLDIFNNNCNIFISGDSQVTSLYQLAPQNNIYDKYQLIFHDCEFAEYPNSVHAQFHELCSLPAEIKSKMWLYHFSLNGKHIWEYEKLAEQNGFAGVVRRGQTFDTKNYSRS